MIEISIYHSSMAHEWDEFCRNSRNATFLFQRDYMDYHNDRFTDHSLVARDGNRIVALLPANVVGDTVWSHQGLTYGGWIVPFKHFDATVMLQLFESSLMFLRDEGKKQLVYKPVPHIYHRYPAEDDLYALWRNGAQWTECNISTTVQLSNAIPYDRGNKSGLSTARRMGVAVSRSNDFAPFWHILEQVLASRHDAKPVHSLSEIELLHGRFPDQIQLYVATIDGKVEAGTVMFVDGAVAHSQYIASSEVGREAHALTAVFAQVATDARQAGCRYLDFGTSNELHGLYLNEGLVRQKARLGGRGIAYNTFKINL